ncbi:short chain dehydrogenase domain-containing protein [Ditylenchus destructor]|nr:short chain dehydrogenase domain-containing protein [Ditylenchus destructor]
MSYQRRFPINKFVKYRKCMAAMAHIYWLGFQYSIRQLFVDIPAIQALFFWNWPRLLGISRPKVVPNQLNLDLKEWKEHSSLLREDPSTENGEESTKKIAVVTGGAGTIGLAIIDLLKSLNFTVVALGKRKPANFSEKQNDGCVFVECDLADLKQVTVVGNEIRNHFLHVDVLICAAGVMLHPDCNSHSPDTIEPHLAVNVLSHVQLFKCLRPALEASTFAHPRAVFVSSATVFAGNVDEFFGPDAVSKELWCREMLGHKSYADSKLLISLYARYLAEIGLSNSNGTGEPSKILVGSMHPGIVATLIYRYVFPPYRFLINVVLAPFLRSPKRAAANVLSLVFDDRVKNGAYYEHGQPAELNRMKLGVLPTPFTSNELKTLANGIDTAIEREINKLD